MKWLVILSPKKISLASSNNKQEKKKYYYVSTFETEAKNKHLVNS